MEISTAGNGHGPPCLFHPVTGLQDLGTLRPLRSTNPNLSDRNPLFASDPR